jgi:hypothetical protein
VFSIAKRLLSAPKRWIERVFDRVRTSVRGHVDAWRAEELGPDSSVTQERVDELVADGYLADADQSGTLVPGMRNDVDPQAMALMMGVLTARAEPGDAAEMSDWSTKKWRFAVDDEIDRRNAAAPGPPQQPPSADPPPPPPAPPASGGPPAGAPPEPPDWLEGMERDAWIQARTRAGEYARGLGNVLDAKLETIVREGWTGEELITPADEELRIATVRRVRELTADAVADRKSVEDLASDLGHATQDWSRDWERIARTELQGAYNEGVLIDHVRWEGPDALIARVPEPGACPDCERVCLDGEGRPKVWTARELVANGTNVGVPRASWKCTVWPIHPHCRCGVQAVPPGFEFDDRWALKPARE